MKQGVNVVTMTAAEVADWLGITSEARRRSRGTGGLWRRLRFSTEPLPLVTKNGKVPSCLLQIIR